MGKKRRQAVGHPPVEYKIRPELEAFVALMEEKLREHDGKKSHWSNFTRHHLFTRLRLEVGELAQALIHDHSNIVEEAVDVANFAMMIANVTGGSDD